MAVCSPDSDKAGMDLGEILGIAKIGIVVRSSDNLGDEIFKHKPDVAIDFSNPLVCIKNAKVLSRMKVNMVIGTTGFTKLQQQKLFVLSRIHRTGMVLAPNITLGVNVLMLLSNLAANILKNYDFEILEVHHKSKKDIP